MKGTIDDEINKANSVMLRQVQQNMDNVLNDVQRFSMDISLDPNVESISTYKQSQSNENIHYSIVQLSNTLKRLNLSNGSIDGFYIYFKNMDEVVSPITAGDIKTMHDVLNEGNKITLDGWRQILQQKYRGKFITLESKEKSDTSAGKNIAYIQSIPIGLSPDAMGNIVVLLNGGRFQDMINNIQGVNQSNIFIIDSNNDIIASAGTNTLPDYIHYKDLNGEQGVSVKNDGDEKFTVSYVNSKISQMKYVSITPERIYLQKSRYIQNFAFISLIVAIGLGVLLAYVFSKRNYTPIVDIMNILSNDKIHQGDSKKHSGNNEYKYIMDSIQTAISEKKEINEKLKEQYSELKLNFLNKLILGENLKQLPTQEILSSMDIRFISDSFTVMLICFDGIEKDFTEAENEKTREDYKLMQFIIQNVFEELVRRKHEGYIINMNKMQACLVNFGENVSSQGEDELLAIASEAQEFILKHFKISITVAVGRPHQTLYGIHKSYEEALKAIEYRIVMGQGKVIFYRDIKASEKKYYYPLEVEQRLVNCVKAGDFENTKEIVDDIFKKNFQLGSPSVLIAKCLMFDLTSTMIKIFKEIEGGNEDNSFENKNQVEDLLSCETILEMKAHLLNILKDVCKFVEDETSNGDNRFGKKAMVFIDKNYSNLNLGLKLVAEHFEITTPYVSKLFKEQTGEGILDYINKRRVQEAKRLLLDKNISISEAAIQSGFLSSNSFIRTFKKYEGITPGRYREIS